MKKLWIQILIILLTSVVLGLVYNQFSAKPLAVFSIYKSDTNTDKATGEDLTAYFTEMDAETLDGLRETGTIIILDARIPEKYGTAHIPGAVNLPIASFDVSYEATAHLMTEGKSLVLYCIGEHCIDSSLLARELYKKGHREIFVYKGGIEEWQAMGLPVQTPEGIEEQPGLQEEQDHENHDH